MALVLNANANPFVPTNMKNSNFMLTKQMTPALQKSVSSIQLDQKFPVIRTVHVPPKTDPTPNRQRLAFSVSHPQILIPKFVIPEWNPDITVIRYTTPPEGFHGSESHSGTTVIPRFVVPELSSNITPIRYATPPTNIPHRSESCLVSPVHMAIPSQMSSAPSTSANTEHSSLYRPFSAHQVSVKGYEKIQDFKLRSEPEPLQQSFPGMKTSPAITNKRVDLSRFIKSLIDPVMKDFINNKQIYTDIRKTLIKTFGYSMGAESARRIATTVLKNKSEKTPEEIFFWQFEDEIINVAKRRFFKMGKKVEVDLLHSVQSYDIAMAIAEDWNNLQMIHSSFIPMGISSTYVSCKSERGEVMTGSCIRLFVDEMMINFNAIARYGIVKCIRGILSNVIHHLDFVDEREVEKIVTELEQKSKIPTNLDINNHLIEDYFPNHGDHQHLYDRLQHRILTLLADAIQNNLDIFHGSLSIRQKQLNLTGLFRSIEYLCATYPQLCGLIYIQPFSLFTH